MHIIELDGAKQVFKFDLGPIAKRPRRASGSDRRGRVKKAVKAAEQAAGAAKNISSGEVTCTLSLGNLSQVPRK